MSDKHCPVGLPRDTEVNTTGKEDSTGSQNKSHSSLVSNFNQLEVLNSFPFFLFFLRNSFLFNTHSLFAKPGAKFWSGLGIWK